MSQSFSARHLLLPLVPLYRLALSLREFLLLVAPARRLRFPVVSIGNLSTGGSGKTPLTIALTRLLVRRGIRVDVLSRGYGRQGQWIDRVDENGCAEDFGDEPLLIARATGVPVYVASQRYDAGLQAEADAKAEAEARLPAAQPEPNDSEQTASQLMETEINNENPADQPETNPASAAPETEGLKTGDMPAESSIDSPPEQAPEEESPIPVPSSAAENDAARKPLHVHLLDDGFQHRQLARDVNILLLNQRDWTDRLLPAGNLREPREALPRADVLAIPDNEPELEVALHYWGWNGPVWRLSRSMELPAVVSPVAAFCGIAHANQFFEGLEDAYLEVALRFTFPDHYPYTMSVLEELIAEAREKKVTAIITTEKDLVRMGNLASLFPRSMPLAIARLRVKIEQQQAAIDWLVNRLSPPPPCPPL
jgi:tetraacyldisaccharide-1-P 4'-kinase